MPPKHAADDDYDFHGSFWKDLPIPFQNEDDIVQFANPVEVQRHLLLATAYSNYLGGQMEILTEQIATFEVERDRFQREKTRLERDILASNIDSIAKSASEPVRAAFIYAKATETQRTKMRELEESIEEKTRLIEARQPRVDQFKSRLKVLEFKTDMAREYLYQERSINRVTNNGGFR